MLRCKDASGCASFVSEPAPQHLTCGLYSAGGPDEAEADELADHLSDVASLASGMSAYTDASTAAVSTSAGGSARSTVGGRGAGRARRARGRKGKIRQGTPEEEQKLCTHVCELAPAATLCTQVLWLRRRYNHLQTDLSCYAMRTAVQDALQVLARRSGM